VCYRRCAEMKRADFAFETRRRREVMSVAPAAANFAATVTSYATATTNRAAAVTNHARARTNPTRAVASAGGTATNRAPAVMYLGKANANLRTAVTNFVWLSELTQQPVGLGRFLGSRFF